MSNHFSADNLKFPGDDRRLDLTDVYTPEQAKAAALQVLPDILHYDRTQPATYPNGRIPTDDVYSARFAWLTNGKVPPSGLKPHDDLTAHFPTSARPTPSQRRRRRRAGGVPDTAAGTRGPAHPAGQASPAWPAGLGCPGRGSVAGLTDVLFLGLEAPCERSTGPWRSGVIRPRPTELTGRHAERAAFERLIEAVKSGESRALVVRGDPGVGKTVLLDYLAARAAAAGCRVERAAGVQTEMTLPFAGLHQLCVPMADHLDRIPAPQRDALRTAFGLAAGPPPDRFLVGLAVLSLLCDVAVKRPLICVIDDEQWLDQASAQALGFVARRLAADPVGVVFAAREPGDALTGLPELHVQGLPDDEARALLDAALGGPLDVRVRDLIVAETQGNPLALLELPRGMTTTELAGGFGLLAARSGAGLPGRIEGSFRRQLEALPAQTQRLLLLAAAEPYGDLSLVWRAADRLGIGAQAATPALEAGLVEFGARVRFRHPLLRSTAYQAASVQDRQQVHRTLAEVTDPDAEPDRRAWHRAKAAPGPDEEVAAELERSAGRAQARGGLAAAAAFLERAVLLTIDPARRAERTLAAAQANMQAGAFGPALKLLATAEAGPLDELQSARVDLLRGEIVFASGLGSDAPPLLLKAAKRLEPLDAGLARETYLTAWMAALFAGQLAGAGDLLEVSRAARNLPPPMGSPRPVDLVLDGLALVVTDG
ncbi:MAG TPA: AAA family ATPase, partial [Streptosporangiaceae bacterium]|nr:AAA family ATPase [Streptosporangiaceae bacterium]